jgi:glycine/D-amino acid oxidase-like deaminating enzyme
MQSFWERESFRHYQYIIIGSGIVGLSTAASLLEHDPSADILILERGLLPSGASTRNAGFACFGSLTEILADLRINSPDELIYLVEKRWEGLGRLRYRLGDIQIGFENLGGYELIFEHQEVTENQVDQINAMLFPIFGKDVFRIRHDLVDTMGFDGRKIKYLIENPFEGQINTGEMMRTLIRYVTTKGARIITGADVESFEENNDQVTVHAIGNGYPVEFTCDRLAFCTNAFTGKLLPELDVVPGRGQVIITEPIEDLPFRGVFHYNEGYFYFRNVGQRVLIGGGRNLAFEEETTFEFGANQHLLDILKTNLRDFILPGRDFKVDMQWSGIMAFGKERKPIVEKITEKILAGVRMNGMGVAIGSSIGEELASHMRR